MQRVLSVAGDAGGFSTPTSGKVVISYVDASGTRKYWNGSAFVAGAEIQLVTTITGVESRLAFTPPDEVDTFDVVFRGWINDDLTTTHVETVHYGAVTEKGLDVQLT